MLAPPERRKHTDIAPKEGRRGSSAPCSTPLGQPGSTGSPRARKERTSLPARPCSGSQTFPPGASNQPPPGVLPRKAQCPFVYFTFLCSYYEPPGMIRNTWPLGAAGAQEIRTLKLEENQGSRLGKKHGFRGSGCVCRDVSLVSSGRVRISCLLQAPGVHGSLGIH